MHFLIYILTGFFILIHAILKPDYYWNQWKIKSTRTIIGDKAATVFFFILGVFLIVIGIIVAFIDF